MELARDGAGLPAEQIVADQRLEGLEVVARKLAQSLRERARLVQAEIRFDSVEPAQRQRDLRQVRITRALAHAVDGALDPARAGPHCSERRGRRQAEVVVTVEVNRNVRADPLFRAPDQVGHGFGARDPDRVDDDRLVRTGFDRRLVDGFEVPRVRTRAVHAEEGDRHALLDRERDRVDDSLEHRFSVDTERCELQVRDRRFDHARLDTELDESLHVRVHRT